MDFPEDMVTALRRVREDETERLITALGPAREELERQWAAGKKTAEFKFMMGAPSSLEEFSGWLAHWLKAEYGDDVRIGIERITERLDVSEPPFHLIFAIRN